MKVQAGGGSGFVKYLQAVFAGVVLLSVSPVYALGLGELRVQSALDEPLVAEIEFASITSEELETLKITLGTIDDFNTTGITRFRFLEELQFEVVNTGKSVIRISSQQPIKEPFLQFIIRARWDFGMILSEYTALLDPPLYAGQQPGSVSSPVVLEVLDRPEPLPDKPQSKAEATPDPSLQQPQSIASGFSGTQYGPIARGDTLWGIAAQVDTRDLDVNVFQVMIAFLRNNPNAFVDNNINRLKIGETLRLQDSDSIRSISKAEASRAYQAQIEQWQSVSIETAAADKVAEEPEQERVAEEPGTGADLSAAADSVAETEVSPAEEEVTEAALEQDQQDGASEAVKDAESAKKFTFKIAPPSTGEGSGESITAPDVDVEIEAMRAAIDREINTLREQVAELENKQREMRSLTSAEAELEAVRTKAGDEIDALREQIAFLKKAAVDQEIQALRGQIATMQQGATPVSETTGSSAELAQAQMEIRDLRAQVEALKQAGEAEAGPVLKDFSDLSDQVAGLQDAQSGSPASPGSDNEIGAIKAAAEEQVNAMREQMNAMRVQIAVMKENQTKQDQQNVNLQDRVTQLIDMLEGRVESTVLATLTAPAGGETVEEESNTPAKKKRLRVDTRSDAPPFWQPWLDKLPEDNTTRMAIAGIAVLFLVVIWLLIRRRRSLRDLEDSILAGSAFDGSASLLSGLRTKKKPRYMSELTMAGMGRMEADEVDPLAEAEVYLAYGRVDQAEQVLKEASAREPDRHELTVKLLEIYQQADDVRSFDALVSKLDLMEKEVNPVVWSNVVALRLKMHKNSPLQTDETADTGRAEGSTPPSSEPFDWDLSLDEKADKNDSLDEKIDTGPPEDKISPSSGPAESDLNPFPPPDRGASVSEEDMLSTAGNAPSETGLEFDFGEDALVDDRDKNQGSGVGDADDQSGRWKEVAIKLELAQAYLNMGEKEEALSILSEVEHEGNPQQNSQITELIRQTNRD